MIDARIDHLHRHPAPSLWPLAMALAVGVTFIGAVYSPWAIVWGSGIALIAFAGWAWPRERDIATEVVALDDGTTREMPA